METLSAGSNKMSWNHKRSVWTEFLQFLLFQFYILHMRQVESTRSNFEASKDSLWLLNPKLQWK